MGKNMKLRIFTILLVFTVLFAISNTLIAQNQIEGKCIKTMEGNVDEPVINSVAYSPDGKYIVSCSNNGDIQFWNAKTGEENNTWKSYDAEFAMFSPDGKHILIGTEEGDIEIEYFSEWYNTYKKSNEVVPFIPEGETYRSCNITLEGHSESVECATFSPDGENVISGSLDGTIKIWSLNTGNCIQTLGWGADGVSSVAYSPDGKYFVGAGSKMVEEEFITEKGDTVFGFTPEIGDIKIFDAKTYDCVKTLKANDSGWQVSLAYSPNGKYIISSTGGKTIKMWDVEKGECVKTLEASAGSVSCLAYSPDGKYIVSGSNQPYSEKPDNNIRIWDAESGKCILTLEGHTKGVRSVAFSPDGKHVVSGSNDNTIKIWEIK
jgi:WD40 repeat protein